MYPSAAIEPAERINVSDERASGIFTKMQTANAHDDSQQMPKALRAAAALFKSKVQAASIEAELPATDGLAPTEQPTQRKPRILTVSQAVPTHPEPGIPATPEQGAVKRQPAIEIPASEYGRVRALAKYGMTVEQVAGLYEVTLSEVRRIIRT
jgi:hypothetical protein